jgi:hypothetical protein
MDISSGGVLTGVVRFIYAIICTFALSFSLDWGSRLFLWFQGRYSSKLHMLNMFQSVDPTTSIVISDVACTLLTGEMWDGSFQLKENRGEHTGPPSLSAMNGCLLRRPDFPWYSRPLPDWVTVLFAVVYSVFISMHHLQHWKERQFPVMVFIATLAFIVNRICQQYLFNSSEGASLIGGYLIGACGHLWSRVFRGTSFTVMLSGVQLLFPVSACKGDPIIKLISLLLGKPRNLWRDCCWITS